MPDLIVPAPRRLLAAGATKPFRSRRLEFPVAHPDATAAAERSRRFAPPARLINATARSVDDRGGRQCPARIEPPLAPLMSVCQSGSWCFTFFPEELTSLPETNVRPGRPPAPRFFSWLDWSPPVTASAYRHL